MSGTPIANDDFYTTPFQTSVIIEPLENDTDPDGDPISIVFIETFDGQPLAGDLTDLGDGRYRYTPLAGFFGAQELVYQITESPGDPDRDQFLTDDFATISIEVTPPNQRTLDVSFAEGVEGDDGLTPFVFTLTRFAPTENDLQTTDIVRVETDTDLLEPGQVAATSGVDFEPLDVTLTFGPNDGDDDPTNDNQKSVTVMVRGDREVEPDEVFDLFLTYIDGDPGVGPDGFGGDQGINALPEDATGTIFNDDTFPIAVDDTAVTTLETSVIVDLLANDFDPDGDPVTLVETLLNAFSFVTVQDLGGGLVEVTPDPGFRGVGGFEYLITDPGGNEAFATAVIEVGLDDPVILADDSIETTEDDPISFNVLANDGPVPADLAMVTAFDSAGNAIFAGERTALPEGGFLTFSENGDVLFEPASEFEALGFNPQPEPPAQTVPFSYEALDTVSGRFDRAAATIGVRGVNDPPKIPIVDFNSTGFGQAVTLDPAGNDVDFDTPQADLRVTSVTPFNPADGDFTLNEDGTVTFTPTFGFSGFAFYNYTVGDGRDESAPDAGFGQVFVSGATSEFTLSAPVVDERSGVATFQIFRSGDVSQASRDLTFDVLPGTAVEGEDYATGLTLPFSIPAGERFDSVSVSFIDDTVDEDDETLTVRLFDQNADTVVASNVATIKDDDAPLQQVTTSLTILEDEVTEFLGSALYVDPDGSPLFNIELIGSGLFQVFFFREDGISIVPDDDKNGELGSFSIDVTTLDGRKLQRFEFDVFATPVNDAPEAVDDFASTAFETPITLDLTANDSDVDGDPITVDQIVLSDFSFVSAVINPDGTVTVTPDAGFRGQGGFEYVIADPDGATAQATAVFDIGLETVLNDDLLLTTFDDPVTIDVLANDGPVRSDLVLIGAVDSAGSTIVTDERAALPEGGFVTLSIDGDILFEPDGTSNTPITLIYDVIDDLTFELASATLTIEAPGPRTISVETVSIVEGDSGVQNAVVELVRTGDLRVEDPVSIFTDSGTAPGEATINVDYENTFTLRTFAPGQSRVSFPIVIVGDTAVEGDETFDLVLGSNDLFTPNPFAGNLTLNDGVVTILDDDAPAADGLLINGVAGAIAGFADQADAGSSATLSPDGTALTLADNAWRTVLRDTTVTADTVLRFTFNPTEQAELIGIGFETDEKASAGTSFQLAGEDRFGFQDFNTGGVGAGPRNVEIVVGDFFTGSFDRLVFFVDDDSGKGGAATFSDIEIVDDSAPPPPPPPVDGLLINGVAGAIAGFADQADAGSSATLSPDGTALTLADNAWRTVLRDTTVTADTVLRFTFNPTEQAELIGIGFETDEKASAGTSFQLAGEDRFGFQDFNTGGVGAGPRNVEIAVGDFFTGSFDRLVFFVDDDSGRGGAATFSDIEIVDDSAPPPPPPPVDGLLINGVAGAIAGFADQADAGSSATLSPDGTALTLADNAWRTVLRDTTVTADTVLRFTFNPTEQAELIGIGFETDEKASAGTSFQLAGEDRFGFQDFNTGGVGAGPRNVEIAVGDFFTGSFDRLVFFVDDDSGRGGAATFSDIEIVDDSAPPPPPPPPVDGLLINGVAGAIAGFADQADAGSSATLSPDGTALTLADNAWRTVLRDTTVTADTVLRFTFNPTEQAELIGIGFETDEKASAGTSFQLAGEDRFGFQDFNTGGVGAGPRNVEIAVGDFFTGSFDRLVFFVDDDSGRGGAATFSDIEIVDDSAPPPPPPPPVDGLLINGVASPIQDFGREQADSGSSATLSPDGTALTLADNAWRSVLTDTSVDADTVLRFTFNPIEQAELIGVAFETDGRASAGTSFQLAGEDSFGFQDFNTGGVGAGPRQVEIAVGEFFTGDFDRLTFFVDDDGGRGGAATFSDIEIF